MTKNVILDCFFSNVMLLNKIRNDILIHDMNCLHSSNQTIILLRHAFHPSFHFLFYLYFYRIVLLNELDKEIYYGINKEFNELLLMRQ